VQLATSHACRGIDIVLLCTHKHRYVMRAPGSFTAAIRVEESASPAKYKPKRPTPQPWTHRNEALLLAFL
jgi:hypothetical protein